jgi:hypothetical protein
VQVRTFKGWDDHKQPGWLEIDLVAHCGGRLEGRIIWTLVATDIATGWSKSLPVITRDGASVLAAIQRLRQKLSFPLRWIDANNDPAFMNALMEQWCDAPEQGIELTRSRAYQSNDQAWVEQKNGVLIRRLVGLEAAQLLAELYAAMRLFTNLFQPSFKLKSSLREGGRIKRLHHPPRTPLQQLLRTGVLSDQEAQSLRELRKRCDPMAMLATMRSCQSRLALLISGQQANAMAGDPLTRQTPEQESGSWMSFCWVSRPCGVRAGLYRKSTNRGRAAAAAWIPLRPTPISSPNGWRQKRIWAARSFWVDW